MISKLKEEDRDEMIMERLPLDNDRKVRAYQNAKLEGKEAEAEKQLCAISHDIVTTSLELVEEGTLLDFNKNSPNRIQFLDRAAKATKAVTGAAPDQDVLKKALNTQKKKECACCRSRNETCFRDMDIN